MSGRREFLRGLVLLPLIGGGVSFIGQLSAVAEPVTLGLLEGYKTWLHFKGRQLAWEMADHPRYAAFSGGTREMRSVYAKGLVKLIEVGGARRFHRYECSAPASGSSRPRP